MATYKVLQDIEAEDTLIWKLTPRQCIYAAIAVIALYLSALLVMKHAPLLALPLIPFIGFGGFFAFPWNSQQPTEVWALAKIRFALKPRRRIWNQSGASQLVTITAPKKIQRIRTNNLSAHEVRSRLRALADTVDSRGWAVKNVDVNLLRQSTIKDPSSDRLIDPLSLPGDVPAVTMSDSEDIFDVDNNPVAQKLDSMMEQSAALRRQQIQQQIASPGADNAGQANDAQLWHTTTVPAPQPVRTSALNSNSLTSLPSPLQPSAAQTVDSPGPASVTQALQNVQPVAATNLRDARLPALPTPEMPQAPASAQSDSSLTKPDNSAIIDLASNNDLNIATIAREAHVRTSGSPDEVSISLR